MRILHVIDSLEVGGAERMLIEIANGAASDGHQVFACVTRSATTLAGELDPKIKLTVLNRRRRIDLKAMRRFVYEARQQKVDVFHAHGRSTLSFLAAMRTLRMTRVPIVFHDHYGIETDQSVAPWLRLWGRYHIEQYVGVCAQLGDWAAHAGIELERINIIDNAIDFRRFDFEAARQKASLRRQFAIPDELPLGVVVGNIRPEKGVDVLLNALSLSRYRGTFKIVVIGGDRDAAYAAECRNQCSLLGLDETVLFAGQSPDAATLVADADFALLPSRSEGFPVVLIEYMAMRLPFVATKVGGISKRLSSLGLPGLVAAEDARALSVAIDNLLQLTPKQRRKRGEIGNRAARSYFDIRQVMPQWYAVYDAAVAGNDRAAH